jgi:hypothetical protein
MTMMYAQPAVVVRAPPTIVPHAEVATKQEVKHHCQGQEEDEKGKVGPWELHSKVLVDGDAKEGQVWHEWHTEVLLFHQQYPDGHVLHGGMPHLTPEIHSHRTSTLDADACAQRHQVVQACQGITDH